MRLQRRAEDGSKEDDYRKGRVHSDRRQKSPAHRRHQGSADVGVKIKGRAIADSVPRSSSKFEDEGPIRASHKKEIRKSDRSPHRHYDGKEPDRRVRKLSKEPSSGRYWCSDEVERSNKRGRSRSSSADRELRKRRVGRHRSRSPADPSRTDRSYRLTSRHRESPLSVPRQEHYSTSHNDISSSGHPARGLYIPSAKRHRQTSPTSQYNTATSKSHKRFPSDRRRWKSRERSPLNSPHTSPSGHTARKHQATPSPYYQQSPRSRERSPHHYRHSRHQRRRSLSRSPTGSKRIPRKTRRSRTPTKAIRALSRDRKMQSSTRPIQSILDENSRPPSPPRPIPSFDSDSHDAGGVREVFPMHGMKANEVHGTIRPGRPHQIDTRQSYSTSPQWTPTSSHHGSPQSGSPFNHGRGGWGGQQHFHGQSGLVEFPASNFKY